MFPLENVFILHSVQTLCINSLRIKLKENIVTSMSHWYFRTYFFLPHSIRVQRQRTEKSHWSQRILKYFGLYFVPNEIQ